MMNAKAETTIKLRRRAKVKICETGEYVSLPLHLQYDDSLGWSISSSGDHPYHYLIHYYAMTLLEDFLNKDFTGIMLWNQDATWDRDNMSYVLKEVLKVTDELRLKVE